MKLTINSNNELLDESGAVIGPIFDSIANGVVIIPDVQRAYEARMAEMQAAFERAATQAKADRDAALKDASDQAALNLTAAQAAHTAAFNGLSEKTSATVEGLNAKVAEKTAEVSELTAKLDAANAANGGFKSELARLGSAQRDDANELDRYFADFAQKFDSLMGRILAVNARALADDDARKLAAAEAEKAALIAAKEKELAELKG